MYDSYICFLLGLLFNFDVRCGDPSWDPSSQDHVIGWLNGKLGCGILIFSEKYIFTCFHFKILSCQCFHCFLLYMSISQLLDFLIFYYFLIWYACLDVIISILFSAQFESSVTKVCQHFYLLIFN